MKMKLFNIGYILAATLLVAGCTEDEITREPSPLPNPNASNVYFGSENPKSVVLPYDATEYKIVVKREKTDASLTVKVKMESVDAALFTVPQTVTFNAGDADTVLVVTFGANVELMKTYHLAFQLDFNETNPYLVTTNFPRYELNLKKEDFKPFANGTYTSVFFKGSWSMTLEYSESTQTYRFKALWGYSGYDVTFKWPEMGASIQMIGKAVTSGGINYIEISTGYVHPTYGMIRARYINDQCTYDSDTKTITFKPVRWVVDAGSFGNYPEYYEISEFLN